MINQKSIYVYKMWDFWNGYWTADTSSNRERIDDLDSYYWMDAETYQMTSNTVPKDGNLAGY